MKINHPPLKRLISEIFWTAGRGQYEAGRIAHYLVEANLVVLGNHIVGNTPIDLVAILQGVYHDLLPKFHTIGR